MTTPGEGEKKQGMNGWQQVGVDSMQRPVYAKQPEPAQDRYINRSVGYIKGDFSSGSSSRPVSIEDADLHHRLDSIDFSDYDESNPFYIDGDNYEPDYLFYKDDINNIVTTSMIAQDNPQNTIRQLVFDDDNAPEFDEDHDFPDDFYDAYSRAWDRLAKESGKDAYVDITESDNAMVEVTKDYHLGKPECKDLTMMDVYSGYDDARHNMYTMIDPNFKEYFRQELEADGYDVDSLDSHIDFGYEEERGL